MRAAAAFPVVPQAQYMPAAQAARGGGGSAGGQQRVCYRCVAVFRESESFLQFLGIFIFQVWTRRAFAELLPQRSSEGLGEDDDSEEKYEV